ncbi:unnamed protein product [Lota lota]
MIVAIRGTPKHLVTLLGADSQKNPVWPTLCGRVPDIGRGWPGWSPLSLLGLNRKRAGGGTTCGSISAPAAVAAQSRFL